MRHSILASHVAKQDCSSSARCWTNVLVRGYREMQELPREGVNVMVTLCDWSSDFSLVSSSKPESCLSDD